MIFFLQKEAVLFLIKYVKLCIKDVKLMSIKSIIFVKDVVCFNWKKIVNY